RVLRPLADEVTVVTEDGDHPCEHEGAGIWAAIVTAPVTGGAWSAPDYRVRARYGEITSLDDDPYRFLPTLGEIDLHLIGEGRHETLWTVLGANARRYPSAAGD